MAKITVCDLCDTQDKKIERATRYITLKKLGMRIDMCEKHMDEHQKEKRGTSPVAQAINHVRKYLRIVMGAETGMTDKEITDTYLRGV